MANTILIKSLYNAAGVPAHGSNLKVAELAVNTANDTGADGTGNRGHVFMGVSVEDGTEFAAGSVSASAYDVDQTGGIVWVGAPILDEDNMASDDATKLATQQSIKKYVDDTVAGENTIAEMNDVTLTSVADGAMLLYDTGSSVWKDNIMSGDATMLDTGAVSIGATKVTGAMLNDDAISGQSAIGAAPANSDELLLSDGGVLKSLTIANLAANSSFSSGVPTTITVADESSDTTCFPMFATAATGDLGPKSGSNLTFNSSSGMLTATGFTGPLTGLASTATALANARNIGGTSFDGTANIAVALSATATALANARTIGGTSFDGTANITPANATTAAVATTVTISDNESTNESNAILFSAGADTDGGDLGVEQDHSGMTYNPSTGKITATGFIGALTGNASGSAATVTTAAQSAITSLGTLTGLSMTGDLNMEDSDKIVMGVGNDVEIYHDGSNTYFKNGTGALKLATETSGIVVTIGHTTSEVTVADNLTVTGDLTVSGATTSVNTATLDVVDLNITVGKNATTSSAANGAGLTFGAWSSGTIPTLTWDHSNTRFAMNKDLATDIVGDVTGDVSGSSATCTGLAGSATILASARNIGGVSFNGSANIDLPGVNTAGNQATSGLAATATLAASATALANARTIGGTSFDGTANIAVALASVGTAVTVADESSDTTCFPLFATAATGDLPPKSGSNLTFNSSSGLLTSTLMAAGTFTGAVTGDVTGNADTATKIASITNSNIVQLTASQTLTNKTLTSPILTTPALGTPASGVITNCTSSGMVMVAPVLGTPASGALTNCTALPAAQVTAGTMQTGMTLVAPNLGTPASYILHCGSYSTA